MIDHITSGSALVVPVGRIVAACHAAGVPVLVDGAHAPGHVDVDLNGARRGLVYRQLSQMAVRAERLRVSLDLGRSGRRTTHPTVISHGFGKGYLQEFDWTGTRDPIRFPVRRRRDGFPQRTGWRVASATKYRRSPPRPRRWSPAA